MQDKASIGLIGLAVMGENLARNLADKQISTVVYNRSYEKTKSFMERFAAAGYLSAAESLAEFVSKLQTPRKIILMVKAGQPVDQMLAALIPLLDKGDIIIDGGNSLFSDTQRRANSLHELGLRFVGMGVSGGEEGALKGPSLMPGGDQEAYRELAEFLQKIAAKAKGRPCVSYVGADGAGHYVKMVHNGIEYADMQLIAEVYFVMKELLGLSHAQMAAIWAEWNAGELESYLVEITAAIMRRQDDLTAGALLEQILDVAGQKGTGKWTSQSALDLGVPIPTIAEAVFARYLSAYKQERLVAAELFAEPTDKPELDQAQILRDLHDSLYAAKICAYAQGFALLKAAAQEYNWQLNFADIALLWRSGCIIRAAFLDRISDSFAKQPELNNLLLDEYFASVLKKSRVGWVRIVNLAKQQGLPIPALNSALDYFDGYKTAYGNANLLQAQRDYFGAHTYRRLYGNEDVHTNWES